MIKDELSSGMVVETRNGGRYVVVKGVSYRSAHDGIVFLGKTGWLNADNFTDDLINTSFSSFDIVRVYDGNPHGIVNMIDNVDKKDLRWEETTTDWDNVEEDTKIIVHTDCGESIYCYFNGYDPARDLVYYYPEGTTSWSFKNDVPVPAVESSRAKLYN